MTAWEEVTYTKLKERTERLLVPGGWLYRTQMLPYVDGPAPAVALVFVPVPNAAEVSIGPGDVLAFTCDRAISRAEAELIGQAWKHSGIEGVEALVVSNGMALTVIHKDQA